MQSSIYQRRSIRKYTKQAVTKDQIEELLSAAMAAPSARNKKPWHFIVIEERSVLDKIPDYHPYAKMLYEAPLAMLVCGDLELDENIDYLVQNCSAATQNILLRATELGLGTVWLGVYPREPRMEGLVDLFNLPEHIKPISLIAIGYPAEKKEPKMGLEWDKVSFNKFIEQ